MGLTISILRSVIHAPGIVKHHMGALNFQEEYINNI